MSKTIECVLSPSRLAPHSGSAAAIASEVTCTMRASTPAAAARTWAIASQVSTSSEVMWNASPSARDDPSSGTKPRAKSSWWVRVHSEVPSPCTTTSSPARIRSTMRPAAVQGDQGLVVGVGRPDDRRREALVAVRRHEHVLGGDLVAGVVPVRVAQGSGLHDGQPAGRRLVRRGRADEDVLPGPAAEQVEVRADVLRRERDPVDDDVVLLVAEHRAHRGGVAQVRLPQPRLRRERALGGLAPVEHVQVEPPLDRQRGAGGADDAAAAEEEDLESAHPGRLARRRHSGSQSRAPAAARVSVEAFTSPNTAKATGASLPPRRAPSLGSGAPRRLPGSRCDGSSPECPGRRPQTPPAQGQEQDRPGPRPPRGLEPSAGQGDPGPGVRARRARRRQGRLAARARTSSTPPGCSTSRCRAG